MTGVGAARKKELLEKRLIAKRYQQSNFCPGFWKHDTRSICVSLCVDDFRVKCVGEEHTIHIMGVLKLNYAISHEWGGT